MARDFGFEAQKAAEAHLEAVQEAYWAEEEAEEGDAGTVPESPASAPYCSCTTCNVREVLFGAWPVIDAYCDDAVDGLRSALRALITEATAGRPLDDVLAQARQALEEAS